MQHQNLWQYLYKSEPVWPQSCLIATAQWESALRHYISAKIQSVKTLIDSVLPHLLATHHISTFNIGLVDSWLHTFPLCNVHWQVANWWQTIVSPSGNSADRTLPFRQCRQTNYPLHLSISVILLCFNYFFSNPSSLQSLVYVSGVSIEVNQASHFVLLRITEL